MFLHEFNWKREVIQPTEPVLVDFRPDWCPPCRAMNRQSEAVGCPPGIIRIYRDSSCG
jgi:thioredoxin 1